MANRYLAFDLEIAAIIPDDCQDWKQYRPLGITCAAIAWAEDYGGIETQRFFAGKHTAPNPTSRMSPAECHALVDMLCISVKRDGFTLLTHNGVSFDFDILAEESGMFDECKELALNSVDTCLQVFCHRGYPVGLDAMAKGFGLPGKMEGVSGAKAPEMWANGEYDTVLSYVAQDARTTLEVALAIEQRHALKWISRSGRLNTMPTPRLLTARECLTLPLPNTEWMTGDRLTRDKFTGWMNLP